MDDSNESAAFRKNLRSGGPISTMPLRRRRKPKKRPFCPKHPNGGVRCRDCQIARRGHSDSDRKYVEKKVERLKALRSPKQQLRKPKMTVAGLQAEFRKLDTDGDGRVTRQELYDLLLGQGLEEKEARKHVTDFFNLSDYNDNGWVSSEEFIREYVRMQHFKSMNYLRKNFKILDEKDGKADGQIEKDVFLQVLTDQLGAEHAETTVDRLFSDIDVDNSGSISFDEWCHWYQMEADMIEKNRDIVHANLHRKQRRRRHHSDSPSSRNSDYFTITAHLDDSIEMSGHRFIQNHVRPVLHVQVSNDGLTIAGLFDAVEEAMKSDESIWNKYDLDRDDTIRTTLNQGNKNNNVDTDQELRKLVRGLQQGEELELQIPVFALEDE